MSSPFLVKLKRKCNRLTNNTSVFYSMDDDVLMIKNGKKSVLAIQSSTHSLGTKKETLEKGEDESPNMLWEK